MPSYCDGGAVFMNCAAAGENTLIPAVFAADKYSDNFRQIQMQLSKTGFIEKSMDNCVYNKWENWINESEESGSISMHGLKECDKTGLK